MDKLKKFFCGVAACFAGLVGLFWFRKKEKFHVGLKSYTVKEEKEKEIEETPAKELVENSAFANAHKSAVESIGTEFRERSRKTVEKLLQERGS